MSHAQRPPYAEIAIVALSASCVAQTTDMCPHMAQRWGFQVAANTGRHMAIHKSSRLVAFGGDGAGQSDICHPCWYAVSAQVWRQIWRPCVVQLMA